MKENLVFITLGEITLTIAAVFDHINIVDATSAFVYAIIAGVGALIPKLAYNWIKRKFFNK